jgi:putative hydrolase of the HAD superfamily
MNRKGIIFDGDDTLWATQALYVETKTEFFREMQRYGFHQAEIEAQFEKIDVRNVRTLGFSKVRFPKSMADTYRALCGLYKRPVDNEVKAQVEIIGYSVFEKTARVVPGVYELLDTLRAYRLSLVLATKGDQEVQQKRVFDSNLNVYFERIYVFPDKGGVEFRRIIDECRFEIGKSWSIGNSMKSDINPAMRIGMNAIWIPNETWSFEHEEPIDKDKFFRARSITDVPSILASNSAEIGA